MIFFRKVISAVLIAAVFVTLVSCAAPGNDTPSGNEIPTESGAPTGAPDEEATLRPETGVLTEKPENNETVSLLTAEMTEWVKNYKTGNVPQTAQPVERCEPVPVSFSWHCQGADYSTLLISESPDMSSPEAYLTLDQTIEVEDLLPGRQYYWQVVCSADGEKQKSEVSSFKTLDTPRTVYIPGVSNVRDIGGRMTSSGKRVRYGIVYRGADFANLKEEGIKKAVDILGIRTELDLRSKVKGVRSPLGKGIKYVSVTAPYYTGIASNDSKEDLLEELRVFCDPENYPVYFHCSLGRDRTGTLAFLLLAIAGVSEQDVYMDYEISFFSDFGGYIDGASLATMLEQLGYLKNLIMKDKTLSLEENTVNYLIAAGLTEAEIESIRANLLEG